MLYCSYAVNTVDKKLYNLISDIMSFVPYNLLLYHMNIVNASHIQATVQ